MPSTEEPGAAPVSEDREISSPRAACAAMQPHRPHHWGRRLVRRGAQAALSRSRWQVPPRSRFAVLPFAGLLVALWASSCGEGGTAPDIQPAPRRPTTVAVTPPTPEITAIGVTLQMAAEVRDQNGDPMTSVAVSWSTNNASVVTVGSSGLVTAVGSGTATVRATAGTVSGIATVTVVQVVHAVTLSPAADTLLTADTVRLTAEAADANRHMVAGAEFEWVSSDTAVAVVDGSGLVTGVKAGLATVTASSSGVTGSAKITVADLDRAALAALFNATDGPNWINSDGWLTDEPLGTWHGVDADASGRVVRLVLGGQRDSESGQNVPHGLDGPIPPELGNLTRLQLLDLANNELSGPIPSELGDLASLTTLSLYGNDLTGPIPPQLGGLAKLRTLYLHGNNLSGPIPPQLGNLSSLRTLRIELNDLAGSLPSELGKLANLTYLALNANSLVGSIPSELGGLSNLSVLELSGNNLTGTIPGSLSDLSNLRWLSIGSNDLSGSLPPELGRLAKLEQLYVYGNRLTGTIPRALMDIHGLRVFRFNGNDSLCAPGTTDLVVWLEGIEHRSGPFCNQPDRDVLESLFESAGGSGW